MLPDQVSNPGPLTYESGALPIALRGPARAHSIGSFMPHNSECETLFLYIGKVYDKCFTLIFV